MPGWNWEPNFRSVGGGRALTNLGLMDPADSLLSVAEYVNPTVKGLALSRGIVKLSLNDADLAIRYLEIANRTTPDQMFTMELLVKAYELAKRNHEADTLKLRLKELKEQAEAAAKTNAG